jgi:hypothetical protein
MDGDVLRFTVMDKDTFPKPDDFLGKAELTAQDVYPNGFHGELALADSKTQATLSVMVAVIGCDEAAPQLVEGEDVQMMVTGESIEGTAVEGSPSIEVLASGVIMQGLQVYSLGVLATATTTSHSMTCSAPQTDSTPQVPMDSMVTISTVEESQSIASQSITYEAPQAPEPSESVAATDNVVVQPVATPVATVTAEELATGKVVETIVHPPVTVTAEEFAKINGSMVTEPLPESAEIETVGVGTKREVDSKDTEAVDETVKIKKKKSKRCC